MSFSRPDWLQRSAQLLFAQVVNRNSATAESQDKLIRCENRRSKIRSIHSSGEVPEWLKGADCKSAGCGLRWFESTPHQFFLSLVVLRLVRKHIVLVAASLAAISSNAQLDFYSEELRAPSCQFRYVE